MGMTRTSLVLSEDVHHLVDELDGRAALALRLAHDVWVASFVGLDWESLAGASCPASVNRLAMNGEHDGADQTLTVNQVNHDVLKGD